jgi:hypothetical protein
MILETQRKLMPAKYLAYTSVALAPPFRSSGNYGERGCKLLQLSLRGGESQGDYRGMYRLSSGVISPANSTKRCSTAPMLS